MAAHANLLMISEIILLNFKITFKKVENLELFQLISSDTHSKELQELQSWFTLYRKTNEKDINVFIPLKERRVQTA